MCFENVHVAMYVLLLWWWLLCVALELVIACLMCDASMSPVVLEDS